MRSDLNEARDYSAKELMPDEPEEAFDQNYNCITLPGVCDSGHIEICRKWNEGRPAREYDKYLRREALEVEASIF